jgi:rhodanese-related sulfurtransferase
VAAELQDGDVMLVDAREQNERDEPGTIAGAVHAPRGMLEFSRNATATGSNAH